MRKIILFFVFASVVQHSVQLHSQGSDIVRSSDNVSGRTIDYTDVLANLLDTATRKIVSAKSSGYAGKDADHDVHSAWTKNVDDQDTETCHLG